MDTRNMRRTARIGSSHVRPPQPNRGGARYVRPKRAAVRGKKTHSRSLAAPVAITCTCNGQSYLRRKLLRIVSNIYRGERISARKEVSIVLCSDALIRRLNARYRSVDRPTDVLSFSFDEPDFLGEIYISLPRCRVQARRYGVDFCSEVLRMAVHGMVHLLGYDHSSPGQQRRMEEVEKKYCSL